MARKHSKRGVMKSPVATTTVSAPVTTRKILTNPTTGELEVVTIVTPAIVQQGKALRSTTKRGEKNVVPSKPSFGGKK